MEYCPVVASHFIKHLSYWREDSLIWLRKEVKKLALEFLEKRSKHRLELLSKIKQLRTLDLL